MRSGVMTRKLTITVTTDFYEGLVRSAGHRKIGAFIEKHLTPLVASNANLDAGYRAMAADAERESCLSISARYLLSHISAQAVSPAMSMYSAATPQQTRGMPTAASG